jgi:hypothetical protein
MAGALRVAAPAALAAGTANEVIAIPVDRGWLGTSNMQWSVTAPLAGDGTFSLQLDKSSDWLLVLADTNTTGVGRFLGSVNVRTDVGADLIELPFTTAAIDVLALGTVTHTLSWDATSGTTVDATAFKLNDAQLSALAKSDDIFRNAMNLVNNYGTYAGPGVSYYMRTDFGWWDAASVLTTSYSDPAVLAAGYQGQSFQLETNQTEFTIDALCAHSTIVTVDPPGVVTIDGVGYSASNPLTSANVTCDTLVTNSGTSMSGWSGPLYMSGGYGPAGFSIKSTPTSPPGLWTWKVNGNVRAQFDVAGVNPPVTDTGAPKGIIPSFKINTQPDGRITSVDVKWFYYAPETGTFVLLDPADLAVLRYLIRGLEVNLSSTVGGVTTTESLSIDPTFESRAIPTRYTWYYGGTPPTPQQAAELMGFYDSGGFGYFFHFPPR